jgi:DNA replication protein DnaC
MPDTALVLDDLDKVRPSDHAREPIYVAVNAWVEAEMPLIVTMNRSLLELADEFGDRYGDAIASRLAGYCEEFEVGGRDRRVA